MLETIKEVFIFIAPIIAGFITSIVIPFLIKKITIKYLKKKIDDAQPTKELQNIDERLKSIEREIFELRGKRK